MTDELMDRIKAHRSAPDVYDPPSFEAMAERIEKLEKAYDTWADVATSYKRDCDKAEAKLEIAWTALGEIANMKEGNVTAYIQKVDAIALDAMDAIKEIWP
jgi:phage shock protein A